MNEGVPPDEAKVAKRQESLRKAWNGVRVILKLVLRPHRPPPTLPHGFPKCQPVYLMPVPPVPAFTRKGIESGRFIPSSKG